MASRGLRTTAQQPETVEGFGETDAGIADRYIQEIYQYEKSVADWWTRGLKIYKRYRDDRDAADQTSGWDSARFSLLWANIQVWQPITYARVPRPAVSRTFKDRAPVARVAAMIVQRGLSQLLENEQFDDCVKGARGDYLLVGRGTLWNRYDVDLETEETEGEEGPAPRERMNGETIQDEYVSWRDFGHTAGARRWSEVKMVWRRVYLDRDELEDRFGFEIGSKVPLDYSPERDKQNEEKNYTLFQKACVYEIWDADEKRVVWISKGYTDGPLDMRDDPYRLTNFFPCPKPVFATMTPDTLVPIPDYAEYQDQAEEIDALTARIGNLQSALRVRGVYAADIPEIRTMLQDGNNNELIPIQNWAMFADKGGLEGTVSWFPLEMVLKTLLGCYEARQRTMADVQQITGLSDIIRGSTEAQETATAQQLKSQWGSVRIRERQRDFANFLRGYIRIKAEILLNVCSPQTILDMADASSFNEVDQQLIPQAMELLGDGAMRRFKIDIETDSTVEPDETAEREARTELVGAVGIFLEKALPVVSVAPELLPMYKEMLLFAVRGFKAGEALEGVIEQSMDALEQAAAQKAQNPQPNPEQMKAEAQAQAMQQNMQMEQQHAQQSAQLEQQTAVNNARLAQEKAARSAQLSELTAQHDMKLAEVKAQGEAGLAKYKAEIDAFLKEFTVNADVRLKNMTAGNQLKEVIIGA